MKEKSTMRFIVKLLIWIAVGLAVYVIIVWSVSEWMQIFTTSTPASNSHSVDISQAVWLILGMIAFAVLGKVFQKAFEKGIDNKNIRAEIIDTRK